MESEKLTVVVPVYNEVIVLPEFLNRISKVFENLDLPCELLFIDDGSTDGSLDLLHQWASKNNWIGYIELSRNFGKEHAMSAGLDHAEGDAVVVIDADLQDPPELIPEMIRLWRKGADTVYAQRSEREGEGWLKKTTAHYFYRLMGKRGRVTLPEDTGDFRLLSRRSILALRKMKETNRFMKGLFAWIGYKQVSLRYRRDPRYAGESKFNYWRLWNFALDGITSFTTLPLKVASYIGFIVAFLSLIYGTFIVTRTLLFGDPVAGFPTLVAVILFLGGVQLLFMGILGEYVGRMFDETKRRPLYLVSKISMPQNAKEPSNGAP